MVQKGKVPHPGARQYSTEKYQPPLLSPAPKFTTLASIAVKASELRSPAKTTPKNGVIISQLLQTPDPTVWEYEQNA